MHPAFSVISFTTLLGAAQGLITTLGVATLLGVEVPGLFAMLLISIVMLIVSLGASFLHLGHPERAWRAMMMWRTSWLSREVIVLPAFIGLTCLWALLEFMGERSALLIVIILAMSVVLWICTAMIYACIKFIQEWAHPITLVNYTLLGIASGLVLTCSLLALLAPDLLLTLKLTSWAVALTLVAMGSRWISLSRNARLSPKSTLQSATGVRNTKLVQKSMGMSAGAFNTREFFHGQSDFFVRNVKSVMLAFCFALPVILLLIGGSTESRFLIVLAFPAQYLGLLAERWLFFAQARHPQNLYYQTVS
jgi:sulfite dehydrogenase (quinone) subunit SoeC